MKTTERFTENSTIEEVIREPAFAGFGHLLFPVDLDIRPEMTLRDVSSSRVYLWYSEIHPEKTVEIVNDLYERAVRGEQIFYPIYSEQEQRNNPDLKDTGLFYLRGRPGARFAIMNAGGGFYYVGAMHDSFPHALEVSRRGYNAFVMIYRPHTAWQDLARAICLIEDNAGALQVNPAGYSLWGGSAGARIAAVLGNRDYLRRLTGREVVRWQDIRNGEKPGPRSIAQASAVIMQYTGYDDCSPDDAPTYACVGTDDGIAWWRGMKNRLARLGLMHIPTEFHLYPRLHHGFGIGTGTAAEGWADDAVQFWNRQAQQS